MRVRDETRRACARAIAGAMFACALLLPPAPAHAARDRGTGAASAPLSPRAAARPPDFERVPGIRGVAEVSTGFGRACARMQNGTVECWEADPTQRRRVPGLSKVIQIAVSDDFACALTNDLDVKCWGANASGQLGDGTTFPRDEPVKVLGVEHATAIGLGLAHACALLQDGTARCWGSNGHGETGDGTRETPRTTPVQVQGLGKTTQMALARSNRTSCARQSTGEVKCWGKVRHEDVLTPAPVTGLDHVAQIAVALDTFCARMEDATVRCWGGNNAGQVGDGRTKDVPAPEPVAGVDHVVAIIPGADHTCAQVRDGTLRCWGGLAGAGDEGVLPLDERITKLALPGRRRILRFALMQTPNGALSVYAVADDGTLWWVAAPERRLAGKWLGVDRGTPFTRIRFQSTPNGFGSTYDALGTAPAPGCRAPRCAPNSGESGEYAVRGNALVLSGHDRTIPDAYSFELSTSELVLRANGYPPFKFVRACDSADACETFDLSRPRGRGAWSCEHERCFWIGASDLRHHPKTKKKSRRRH